jgi:hypothetical protein
VEWVGAGPWPAGGAGLAKPTAACLRGWVASASPAALQSDLSAGNRLSCSAWRSGWCLTPDDPETKASVYLPMEIDFLLVQWRVESGDSDAGRGSPVERRCYSISKYQVSTARCHYRGNGWKRPACGQSSAS